MMWTYDVDMGICLYLRDMYSMLHLLTCCPLCGHGKRVPELHCDSVA